MFGFNIDKLIGKGLGEFAHMGVNIEKADFENKKLYITVPATSESGQTPEEIAGIIKDSFRGTPVSGIKVLYKVREEHWTGEKEQEFLDKLKAQIKAELGNKGIKL